MPAKNKDLDRRVSAIRSPYERVFSQQNKRVRYCGIAKNQFAAFMEAICFNLKRLTALDPPDFVHGNRYLSTLFARLMLLAFLIDQIQRLCCNQFKMALRKPKRKNNLWEKMRAYFIHFLVDSWDDIMAELAYEHQVRLVLDTT